MTEILQNAIPYDVLSPRPLPGVAPLEVADWLVVDEAFAVQMAERARLMAGRRADVVALTEAGQEPAAELLEYVLAWLSAHAPGYDVAHDQVRRPDGGCVTIDQGDPMGTLGHLVQEDLCLMVKEGEAHILAAASLCFPASWQLSQKIGRSLGAIHAPVSAYDAPLERRVQRLFDGVQVGRPLWRFNVLQYADPMLFQPRSEEEPRVLDDGSFPYVRSERQCVLRLPRTRAVVFSIHTYVVPMAVLKGRDC